MQQSSSPAGQHHREIKKKGSKKYWKVDELRVAASTAKDVTWECKGSEFVIWFPPEWNPLNGPNQLVSKSGACTASLRSNLKKDEVYQYSIFCYKDKEMAEGGSSPEMIIE